MDFALTNPPTFDLKQLGLLRYRGRRGGGTVRLDITSVSHQGNSVIMNENVSESYIPTVYNRPAIKSHKHNHASVRPRVLVQCTRSAEVNMKNDKQHQQPPSIYMINSGSLAKPHAKQHLQADISSIQPDVVIVVESWLSEKHADAMFEIPGYTLHRRDRCHRKENGKMRRGGGVAVYVGDRFESRILKPITDRDCSLFRIIRDCFHV